MNGPWPVALRDVGIAVAAGVAVLAIASAFTDAVSLPGLLDTQSRVLLSLAGLGWGLVIAWRFTRADLGGYRPAERERIAPVAVPGDDLDDLFALGASGPGETARYYRSRGRDRLEALAVRVLVTHAGCSTEAAHRQLREGTWTDDPAAARVFTRRIDAGVGDAVGATLGRSIGRAHPHTRRARRAVAELDRIAEAEDG